MSELDLDKPVQTRDGRRHEGWAHVFKHESYPANLLIPMVYPTLADARKEAPPETLAIIYIQFWEGDGLD